ncbi:rolling circle replication-associated protein [Alkalibacterium kapii]|uniref:Replication-associated protein ORF2/G2P domain-containing protein n=1 Tax=Alkalibacterium kapii TaxID=426704 RepID=A0A511AVJ1_9LACT|nr:hypothetical protein [Alkalibacterium kapii]GEK92228.1 hypothetical protein AKA01nite_18500 [Alkalibacterium kapii]
MAQIYGKTFSYPDGSGYVMIYKQAHSTYDSGPEKKKKERDDLFELSEEERDEENAGRSARRSKKAVRDYVACNTFTHFVTLTFRDEQSGKDDYRLKVLTNWLRYMKKKHGKFNYVVIPERHKDGRLHFHGAVDLTEFELEKAYNKETGKPIIRHGNHVRDIIEWQKNNGWGSAEIIRDQKKTANYMTKYITKDFETTVSKHKKKYWCSKGLNKPVQKSLRVLPQFSRPADWENDFVIIYNIDDMNSIL